MTPTKLATIQRNVRAAIVCRTEDPQRGMGITVKVHPSFGALFLHIEHICGRAYEVGYSMQGVDTDPELDAILAPIFEGISEGLRTIRKDWDEQRWGR